MAIIKLFVNLMVGDWFYFHDKPGRKLIKSGDTHFVSPTGSNKINPHVLIVAEKETERRSYVPNNLKGVSDESVD